MLKQLTLLSLMIFSLPNMVFAAEIKAPETRPLINASVGLEIRYSKHEGFSRLVFETKDEGFVKDTSITQAEDQILVQFPSVPKVTIQGRLDIEASIKGKSYKINMKNPFKLKVMRLSSPPRISVDIFIQPKDVPAKPIATEGSAAGKSPWLRIVLDPGHGGYDLGLLRDNMREKDLTLSVAREVEATVSRNSKTISLTRNSDQFMSILDRALLANQRSPDIFISLHISATEAIVIYTSPSSAEVPDAAPNKFSGLIARQRGYAEKIKAFSEGMGKAFRDEFKTTEVVFRDMPLPLLNSIAVPAVMVEVPVSLAAEAASKKRLSGAIIKGIAAYANK